MFSFSTTHRITNRVVALLHIIPTDPAVIDMVDNVNTAGFPGANGDTESLPGSTLSTPSVSPSPSPRKVRNSTGSTYGSQTSMHSRKSSSTSKLVGLFNNKGTGSNRETSPFRVRYNLEVRLHGSQNVNLYCKKHYRAFWVDMIKDSYPKG